ncbi:MAG: hypothetical protein LC640_07365 [Frankia sp.]|nr:hypothetical protein [Frankia sp.]
MKGALGAIALVLWCAGCARSPELTFADPPSAPATAPPSPVAAVRTSASAVEVYGELALTSRREFQCSYAVDDFFVRGELGDVDGLPVYVSINVERFTHPGRYPRVVQVLLRRVSANSSFYASWYSGTASMTVLSAGRGGVLEPVTLAAEPGGQARGPVGIHGSFICARGGE